VIDAGFVLAGRPVRRLHSEGLRSAATAERSRLFFLKRVIGIGPLAFPGAGLTSNTDTAGEKAIVDQIVQAILNEVCEYFDFDGEDRTA
jgi:hypothetical protein